MKVKNKTLHSRDMKERNRLTILKMIYEENCSRANISLELGMSRPAVSSIVTELMNEGLVTEVGRGQSTETGGKRPTLLDINAEAGSFLSVYYNGEFLEVGIIDLKNNVRAYKKKVITNTHNYEAMFKEIIKEIKNVVNSDKEQKNILACGLVLKGVVNTGESKIIYSATLPEWENIPLSDYFKTELKIPVFVENDARAQTLKILQMTNKPINSLVCINLGIGIGTGIVINGEIYRGATESAGLFAHTTILDDGPLCSCGNKGCWEALASISSLKKELVLRDESFSDKSFEFIISEYKRGNEVVNDVVINHIGYWIGVGLSNILRIINPESLVIIGEMTKFGEKLEGKIKEVVYQRTKPAVMTTNINFSEVDKHFNVQSAVSVARNHFFSLEQHKKLWTT